MPVKVVIQGQTASFHDIAARQFLGDDIEIVGCDTFSQVFDSLTSGKADKAVVAIENSLFGSINEVYDLLISQKFWISGEVYLRINQCLIGLPGAKLEDIREVHSHLVALAQCEDFLDQKLPNAERFEHHDTAGSVADIIKWSDPAKAAIASAEAAKLHGAKILAKDIETNKQNYTRFVVLDKQKTEVKGANKTSLVLVTGHKPGALYSALGTFASRKMNLTKLQSRPIIGQAWHYMFYLDVAGDANSNSFKKAAQELTSQDCQLTILGSYKAGRQT